MIFKYVSHREALKILLIVNGISETTLGIKNIYSYFERKLVTTITCAKIVFFVYFFTKLLLIILSSFIYSVTRSLIIRDIITIIGCPYGQYYQKNIDACSNAFFYLVSCYAGCYFKGSHQYLVKHNTLIKFLLDPNNSTSQTIESCCNFYNSVNLSNDALRKLKLKGQPSSLYKQISRCHRSLNNTSFRFSQNLAACWPKNRTFKYRNSIYIKMMMIYLLEFISFNSLVVICIISFLPHDFHNQINQDKDEILQNSDNKMLLDSIDAYKLYQFGLCVLFMVNTSRFYLILAFVSVDDQKFSADNLRDNLSHCVERVKQFSYLCSLDARAEFNCFKNDTGNHKPRYKNYLAKKEREYLLGQYANEANELLLVNYIKLLHFEEEMRNVRRSIEIVVRQILACGFGTIFIQLFMCIYNLATTKIVIIMFATVFIANNTLLPHISHLNSKCNKLVYRDLLSLLAQSVKANEQLYSSAYNDDEQRQVFLSTKFHFESMVHINGVRVFLDVETMQFGILNCHMLSLWRKKLTHLDQMKQSLELKLFGYELGYKLVLRVSSSSSYQSIR